MSTIDEDQIQQQWFEDYQLSIRKLVTSMQEKGYTLEYINRNVLPRCDEFYRRARDESLEKFRHIAEINSLDDDSTKH